MYSIGKFSNLCNVPVKTIRYYSDIGLLEPSFIDEVTGYRYFDYDKMKELNKIQVLKNCHFSLKEIEQIMKGKNDRQDLELRLHKKVQELEHQQEIIAEQIQNIVQVKNSIQNAQTFNLKPTLSSCYIEERPKIQVLAIREKINIIEMDRLVRKLFERIYAYQLEIEGKLTAIFHQQDRKQNIADVELLLPVKATQLAEYIKVIPEGRYACINIKGPYSELNFGYSRLQEWLTEQSLHVEGLFMEQYIKGLIPTEVANPINIRPNIELHPNDFLTKVFVKIRN
ncbi:MULTISPECIES: MerR family transcriptional regulator [unclassified Lysinibacillus]|uniref:MerR family transcriptional regulator n=1 Tax=unclassified Lysinibacillus TaxID=2636778 RepID=UPI0035E2AA70